MFLNGAAQLLWPLDLSPGPETAETRWFHDDDDDNGDDDDDDNGRRKAKKDRRVLQSAFNFKAAGKACDWRDDQYVTLQPSAESKSDQPANEIDTHLHTNTNTNKIHITSTVTN